MTLTVIFALILWTMLLVGMIGVYRTIVASTTGKATNSFSPTGEDVSAFGVRLARAHANCYEFLPFALAAMLAAVAMDQTQVTDGLATAFLGARVAQSVVHLLSTSVVMVLVRFVFFLVQLAILVYWSLALGGFI